MIMCPPCYPGDLIEEDGNDHNDLGLQCTLTDFKIQK